MLLNGGEQEVLKSRIHFINFSTLGGVPDRVPQPHKLLLATQKILDWWPLSKMCSCSFPALMMGGNCWRAITSSARGGKVQGVSECLIEIKRYSQVNLLGFTSHVRLAQM